MSEFAIFSDSCCDLYTETRQKYNIEYVPMGLVSDGKEMSASLDWDIYSTEQLYSWLRGGKVIKTVQVPVTAYEERFEPVLKENKDILYLACSSGLSGSINAARLAKDALAPKYPERKIVVIDTLKASLGTGMMAIEASKMRDEGKAIDEVASVIEATKMRYRQVGVPESLTYLKRAGRVKGAAAFFGNLFEIKPVVVFDKAGCNLAIKKVKGRKPSLKEIVNMAAETIEDAQNQTVGIVHADCLDDALWVKEMLEEAVHPKDIFVEYMGPIIGASTGPGTVIIYYKGKEIDF